MLRILLLPILLCFCLPVYGQKVRFTDTSNVWYYTISDQGAFKRTAAYGEDTVMNGHQYRKLEDFWIREDTSARKVYGARSNGNEQILYDYTLAINDTLYCSGYTYPKL